MDVHKNARLTPLSRALPVERVLEQGWTIWEVAHAGGVSTRTGWKWLKRLRDEGHDGRARPFVSAAPVTRDRRERATADRSTPSREVDLPTDRRCCTA